MCQTIAIHDFLDVVEEHEQHERDNYESQVLLKFDPAGQALRLLTDDPLDEPDE